jgi:hypothetical protein
MIVGLNDRSKEPVARSGNRPRYSLLMEFHVTSSICDIDINYRKRIV